MSTFFGGEEIKAAIEITNPANNASSIDIYTCPASRYAHVEINFLEKAVGDQVVITETDGTTNIDPTNANTIPDNKYANQPLKYLLIAGQKIKALGGWNAGSYIHLTIKELLKP